MRVASVNLKYRALLQEWRHSGQSVFFSSVEVLHRRSEERYDAIVDKSSSGFWGHGLRAARRGLRRRCEGPIVPPPPAPAEYADKHMPAGWWADEKIVEEGRKIFIGETNPDVNCASCHGKDGKPVKAGARDFRNG